MEPKNIYVYGSDSFKETLHKIIGNYQDVRCVRSPSARIDLIITDKIEELEKTLARGRFNATPIVAVYNAKSE